jgi:hypothetical protein
MLSVFPGLWPMLQALCILIAFRVLSPGPREARVIVSRSPRRMN